MNAKITLLTLALATAPLYAGQPATPTLPEIIQAAQQETEAPDSPAELAECLPALKLLPAHLNLSAAWSLSEACKITEGSETRHAPLSVAFGTSDSLSDFFRFAQFAYLADQWDETREDSWAFSKADEQEKSRLKAIHQKSDELLTQMLADAKPLHFAPFYIALIAPTGAEEPFSDIINAFESMVHASTPKSRYLELPNGWKAVDIDCHGSLSAGCKASSRRWVLPLFEGLHCYLCYRMDGNVLRICICMDPNQMQWPDSIEDSRVSDADVARTLPAGDGKARFALNISQEMLATLSQGISSMLNLGDKCSAHWSRSTSAKVISGMLESLSEHDASLGIRERQQDWLVQARWGLQGINFLPGHVALPTAAEEDETFFFASLSPMRISTKELDASLAEIIGTMSEGLSIIGSLKDDKPSAALRLNIADAPAFSRIFSKLTGQSIDLSKAVRWQLYPDLILTGKLDGKELTLSSDDAAAAALSADDAGPEAFRGAIFRFRSDYLTDVAHTMTGAAISVVSGALCEKDGAMILHLSASKPDKEEQRTCPSEPSAAAEPDTAPKGAPAPAAE